MAFLHCDEETIVLETRGTTRRRKCNVCKVVFTTEEVLKEVVPLTPAERRERVREGRKLLQCPVSREQLAEMLKTYPSMKAIAHELFVSTTTLNRWCREMEL